MSVGSSIATRWRPMRGNRSVCVCVCVCVSLSPFTVYVFFSVSVRMCTFVCVCVSVCFMLSCVLTGFCVWAVCVCLCMCVCYVFCCVYSCVCFLCCFVVAAESASQHLPRCLLGHWGPHEHEHTHLRNSRQQKQTSLPICQLKNTGTERESGREGGVFKTKNWIIFESLWAIKEKRQSSGWNPPTLKVYLKMTNKQTLRLVDFSLRVKSKQPTCGSVWFLFFRVLWLCFLFLMQQNTRW